MSFENYKGQIQPEEPVKAPEYTELERQRIKERYEALTPEQKQRVREAFEALSNPPKEAPKKLPTVATLTYKQLAANYNQGKGRKNTQHKVRQVVRNMNSNGKKLSVVNGPGSTIRTEEGVFMITKKGKSIRIG